MSRLAAEVLDRAVAWRTGRRYHAHLHELRRLERGPREALDAWRLARLRALLEHAGRHVPYWRELFGRVGLVPADVNRVADLAALPPLTKALINEGGEALFAPQGRGRIAATSTGGSTGRNVWLRLDLETQDRRRAAGRLTEEWDDVRPGTRTATFWGASLDASPSRGARWYDRLTGRLFLSAYGVDDVTLAAHFERLARFRPEVVSSYPSILLHAARRAGKAACRAVGARIVYCSAEALFEPVREELADLFGARVRNRYASREFGLIASDCPAGGGLHVADARLVLEAAGAPGPDGAAELLVTDLDNHAMPLIRYAIEDRGRFAEGPCACGRRWSRLASLDGRVLDVVTTPDGRAFGGTFFTLVFRPFDQSIRQFQAVQDRADHLVIRFVPGPGFDAAHRDKLEQTLRTQFGPSLAFDLVEVADIPPLPSGKRRFVVSEIVTR